MDEDWQAGYDDGYEEYAPEVGRSDTYAEGYLQGCNDREDEEEELQKE